MELTQYKKQLAYETMLSRDMPELFAASIADQMDNIGAMTVMNVIPVDYIYEVLISFQDWEKTREGFEFWAEVTETIGEVALSATIPVEVKNCFSCPLRSPAGYICMRTKEDVGDHIKEGTGVHPSCPYKD